MKRYNDRFEWISPSAFLEDMSVCVCVCVHLYFIPTNECIQIPSINTHHHTVFNVFFNHPLQAQKYHLNII